MTMQKVIFIELTRNAEKVSKQLLNQFIQEIYCRQKKQTHGIVLFLSNHVLHNSSRQLITLATVIHWLQITKSNARMVYFLHYPRSGRATVGLSVNPQN